MFLNEISLWIFFSLIPDRFGLLFKLNCFLRIFFRSPILFNYAQSGGLLFSLPHPAPLSISDDSIMFPECAYSYSIMFHKYIKWLFYYISQVCLRNSRISRRTLIRNLVIRKSRLCFETRFRVTNFIQYKLCTFFYLFF